MTGDNVFVEVAPACNGGFAVFAGDSQTVLIRLVRQVVSISNVVDYDRSQVTHSLFCDSQKLFSVLTKLDSLDGRGEFPRLDIFTRSDVP